MNENESRMFGLGQVLSITQKHLLCDMEDLKDILCFLAGEHLSQLAWPRVSRESEDHILRLHPILEGISPPRGVLDGGESSCKGWLKRQKPRLGDSFALTPLPEGDHTFIAPAAEYLMKKPGGLVVNLEDLLPGDDSIGGGV